MKIFAAFLALATCLGPPAAGAPTARQQPSAQSADRSARPVDPSRLHAWHLRVVNAARGLPRRSSLAELLARVMRGEAAMPAEDPVEENRTALVALAFYVNG